MGVVKSFSMPHTSKYSKSISAEVDQKRIYFETLKEQKRIVEGFIAEATKQRKFDDVQSLTLSLQDLTMEIERTSLALKSVLPQ